MMQYVKNKKLMSLLAVLLMSVGVLLWNATNPATGKTANSGVAATSTGIAVVNVGVSTSTNATVVDVVDGDTIDAQIDDTPDRVYRVRLLGVNTPETVDPGRPVQCYGKEASSFAKKTLGGQRIKLEGDPEADEYDKYGRLLRNIYLADGTDFNAELVSQGYAQAYVSFPQNADRKAELRRLESEAKEAKRGVWDPAVCPAPFVAK
jgi:micrococcal nuclease